MTIFYGSFDIEKQADCRIDLDLMMQSDINRFIDTSSTWYSNNIALGQKTWHVTSESFYDILPFYQSSSQLAIAGNIRVDNRNELFSLLNIATDKQSTLSDARLILFAYEKWEDRCAEFISGEFSFVIWDEVNQKLLCFTDHLGIRGLFYFYNGKKFLFATSPDIITYAHNVPCKVNLNKLATLVSKHAKHLFWGESWFENIFPMPAATVLTISKNGLKKRKYWTPEIGKELLFKNENDFAEAFQEKIFRSVSNQLRSNAPVTALLSGGLDSSAVVSVAAKILEKQNKELNVFSSVLPDKNDLVLKDERYFIDHFRSFPNININYITAPGKGFLSHVEELKTNIYAPNLIPSYYLYTSFVEKARELGSRAILDGGGGELGPSFHGTGAYAELFEQLKWKQLWHELISRKSLTGEPVISALPSQVLRPLLPKSIVNIFKKQGKDSITHFIRGGLAEQLRQRLDLRRNDLDILIPSVSSQHRHNQLLLIKTFQNKAKGTGDMGAAEVRFPLLDKNLLEFCLAVPLDFKVKNGYKRYMVRAGLDKILPPEIQWRNSKSPFAPDYNRRYNEQRTDTRNFLKIIKPNDPVREIVDIEKLLEWSNIPLSDTEYGTFAEKAARNLVPQGIYLIHFLRRFKDFQI